ncbi:MAG: riboflavin kinase, partial [Phycisphaerae bacterium]
LTIVGSKPSPERLSTVEKKLAYLADAGADIVVVAKSEPTLLGLEAERFIEDVIVRKFHPTHVVEGPSFGFGRGRKGTPELLRRILPRYDCEVHIAGPVTVQIEKGETLMVSSSLIRSLLGEGKVRRAALCLGRPYTLIGTVTEGDRRGRTMGFPTVNLSISDQLVPGDGVYAGRALADDRNHLAAISIGQTPTFGGTERRVEAHLLDYTGDLYGESVLLGFERRLREQSAFDSPETLVEQLRRDVDAVRDELGPASADA